jgi:hypothetical protein
MEQLIVHGLADYVFAQSDWMALHKNKRTIPCLVHVLLYTAMFLFLTTNWKALLVIGGTHFIIDRFPIIVKRVIWLKNHMNPKLNYPDFAYCDTTGYYDDSPYNSLKPSSDEVMDWGKPRLFNVTIWLYIITDNLFHLFFNYLALTYFAL